MKRPATLAKMKDIVRARQGHTDVELIYGVIEYVVELEARVAALENAQQRTVADQHERAVRRGDEG